MIHTQNFINATYYSKIIKKVFNLLAVVILLVLHAQTLSANQIINTTSYNIKTTGMSEAEQANWLDTRRWNILRAVEENESDLIGFQEALSKKGRVIIRNQQTELEEVFSGTQWAYYRWDDPTLPTYTNDPDPYVDAYNNKNPIAINLSRFNVVADGVTLIKWTDELTENEFNDLSELHLFFHGQDRDGDGENDFAHHFDPIRHVNWVIIDDNTQSKRIAILNTHYETYPGEDEHGTAESAIKWEYFIELVSRAFEHTSEQLALIASNLEASYATNANIIMGDFEININGSRRQDTRLDNTLTPLVDAGYIDTWTSIERGRGPASRPRTDGVDHIFSSNNLNTTSSYYDTNKEYTGKQIASDHWPLVSKMEFQ
ncbi:MAG: hypothetical protein HRT71_13735 [Flavobacteriales bacterium]|nr:hypothetical protein [Flavobacteriales bacterium]